MKALKTGTQITHTQIQQKEQKPFFSKDQHIPFFSKNQQGISGRNSGSDNKPFFNKTTIQTNLKVGQPNDKYEQEADAVADKVVGQMNAPAPIQKQCATCEGEEEIQQKPVVNSIQTKSANANEATTAPSGLQTQLNGTKGSGQFLPKETAASMGSAIGADFSTVKIHTNSNAVQMNQQLGAQAFAHGSDIYFNKGKYDTNSDNGNRLLAHELTHTVQQGASVQKKEMRRSSVGQHNVGYNNIALARQNNITIVGNNPMIQRWPGDGMAPPGDCSWAKYLPLLLSVNSAKVIVSGLGRCRVGDTCLVLATKIAAVSAEIAARVVRETSCFKGGDTNHRKEIESKINMLNRCYKYFTKSGCPQELIGTMAAVVALSRQVIEAITMRAAAVVVLALVALLVVAIIALAEAIVAVAAAIAASAAASAAVGAAAAVIIVLLGTLQGQMSAGEGEGTSA